MKFFVHLEDKGLLYFVSDDFSRAPRDQQVYPPCVLYILRNIIFKNDDPKDYFYDYQDDNYIAELMYNGPIDYITEAIDPQSAVIKTIFESIS